MLSAEDDYDLVFAFEDILYDIDMRDASKEQSKEICKFFLKGHCMKGKECVFRHVRPEKAVVCKHWLRGLCKKGDACEFLHEYDPKKMPECWFFAKYGECSNPECIFLHIRPEDKIKPCPWYNRGFCKHGASCRFKHIRKVACPDYLAGFCFKGPNCKFAHPKFDMPKEEEPKKKRRIQGGQVHAIPTMGDDEEGGGFAFSRPGMEFGNRAGPEFTRRSRNLSNVECYKCKEFGHYANQCPNKAKYDDGPSYGGGGRDRDYGGRDRGGNSYNDY